MSATGPYSSQIVGTGLKAGQNETPTSPTSHFMLKVTKTKSVVVQTSHTKFAPKYGGGDLGPGDIVRIEVPSSAWLDTENSGLSFDFLIYTDSTSISDTTARGSWLPGTASLSWRWIRHKNGIQSIFNRVKLLTGSSNPIEDIHEYDILDKILLYATAPADYVFNVGFTLEGIHSGRDYWKQVLLNHWACSKVTVGESTNPGHRYFIRPHLGLFRTGKFLPTTYMGLITMEFYLNQPNYCLIRSVGGKFTADTVDAATASNTLDNFATGGTTASMLHNTHAAIDYPNATYRLKNVYWHGFFINPTEDINNAIKEKMEKGEPIKIATDVFRYHTKQIANAWDGQQSVTVQERVASLKGIFAVMINEGDRACPFRELTFHHNDLEEYRWRIAETYYPNQQVQCLSGGVEPFLELQRALGQVDDVFGTNLINWENYHPSSADIYNLYETFSRKSPSCGTVHSDRFILGHNFENSIGQFSGLDLLRMNSDIEITYKLKQAKTAYADTNSTLGPERMVAVIPEADYSAGTTTTRKVILPPPGCDKFGLVSQAASGSANSAWIFSTATNPGTQVEYRAAELALRPLLALAATPLETQGFSSLVPTLVAANTGTTDILTPQGNDVFRWANCTVHCKGPSYYEFTFYTHYDQIVILETFGATSVTTDIYNVV